MGKTISAAIAGNVNNKEYSIARFWLIHAPLSSPDFNCLVSKGNKATPIAAPTTPSGSWLTRSAKYKNETDPSGSSVAKRIPTKIFI